MNELETRPPRNPGKPENEGSSWPLVCVVVFFVLVFFAVVAAQLQHEHRRDGERHEYRGVTWLGDDCRVVDDDVLICVVRQEA